VSTRNFGRSKARKVGRPRKASDVRELVLDVARDSAGWGYTKIRDALRGLKIEVGRTTVASILADAGIEPAPERNRRRTSARFVKSHSETLFACDFFSVEVLGVFGTVRYMVFFVMQVKTRAVQIARVRISPDGDWMKQTARTVEARSALGPARRPSNLSTHCSRHEPSCRESMEEQLRARSSPLLLNTAKPPDRRRATKPRYRPRDCTRS
jgi:hypothetical protein